MTKKDYIILARMLRGHKNYFVSVTAFENLVDDICYALKLDNANFSKDRFKAAVMTETIDGKRYNL